MIDRYTIKFGPAVSQKELEKALHAPLVKEGGDTVLEPGDRVVFEAVASNLHKMKARIKIIPDFADLKKISETLREMAGK
jgi:hypothetical protein